MKIRRSQRARLPEKNGASSAEWLADMPDVERKKFLRTLTKSESSDYLFNWRFWARPKQIAPNGDWLIWLIRAGRGAGKTRSGGGWVHERAMQSPGRWIALVARTPADARDYMIEGPAGILRNTHPQQRPTYEVSKRRLTWPNGSWATVYSDAEPDGLRGFSGDTAWLDELAKYQNPQETWDNLMFGMREPSIDQPRVCITTTPRPIPLLKAIEAADGTIVVVGSSYENKANLDPQWFKRVIEPYEGTRLGRQEINAEILDDVPGALWTREMLDRAQMKGIVIPDTIRRGEVVDADDDSPVDYPSTVGVVV